MPRWFDAGCGARQEGSRSEAKGHRWPATPLHRPGPMTGRSAVSVVVRATDLVRVPEGKFRMGAERFYADEGPVHIEHIDAFAVERHPVTNEQFATFVADTGRVTVAECALDPALFP